MGRPNERSIPGAQPWREGDDHLRSTTHFPAQTDFAEASELLPYINEGQLTILEDMMWEGGFLDAKQMASALIAASLGSHAAGFPS